MRLQKTNHIARNIIHLNLVNFYVSVARALNPRLSSYPVAVATAGASQRVLLDVSSQAREAGIYRNMRVETAKRKCPDLVLLDPIPGAYEQAHTALVKEASRLSPRVETAGPGHVFVDLTGTQRLFGRSVDIADRLRREIGTKYNLPPTVGLAANKLVSKVATRVIKPVGFCTVMHGCEEEFMAPLPVTLMPGIDPKVLQKLAEFNILVINDLRCVSQDRLAHALGNVAVDIYRFSRGIDNVPVRELSVPEPSVERRVVFKDQTNDEYLIRKELFGNVCLAATKLRRMGLGARRIELVLTYADSARVRRARNLPAPVSGDVTLFEQCNMLFGALYTRRIRLASMDMLFTGLCSPYGQLDLFLDQERETDLMRALDTVRGKFGAGVIGFWGVPKG
ncbi:MAG: hypothetical protein GF418_17010 [Chitinivibrionales bacterium]|nr:hypothetical protein [Chitinivibrionales bacterium]MBD3397321.1 hypothetical protein [Chitinivibrionales bacterium]